MGVAEGDMGGRRASKNLAQDPLAGRRGFEWPGYFAATRGARIAAWVITALLLGAVAAAVATPFPEPVATTVDEVWVPWRPSPPDAALPPRPPLRRARY
jgi:hypothetical protein